MKGEDTVLPEFSPAAVKRIQRALAETLQRQTGSTILERTTAVYRIAQAATEAALEHGDPLERETNKQIMRDVLASIMLETLAPDERVH